VYGPQIDAEKIEFQEELQEQMPRTMVCGR
jgi:hypothetical protein